MIWNPKWFPGTNLQDLNLDWILKKIAALRGGTAGQYLYKKSNKDFDFGWKTGGGGGTSDYLDLDNKPSINNVELTGNKTASDLGLATPSDIPVVPVQSVNGKTGDVVLDATDVGAGTYSKPETGIPKTDLSSAVQTSLDKADTALQAVPPTYRTATAQDTIDAAQDAQINTLAGSLAMIETSPATTAHVVGEYIVYNGQLYKVTAAISAGQTLSPGTNISAINYGSIIKNLEDVSGYELQKGDNVDITLLGASSLLKLGKLIMVTGFVRPNAAISQNDILLKLPTTFNCYLPVQLNNLCYSVNGAGFTTIGINNSVHGVICTLSAGMAAGATYRIELFGWTE